MIFIICKYNRYHWHWGAYKQLGLGEIVLKVELSLLKSQSNQCFSLESIKIDFPVIAHTLPLDPLPSLSPPSLSIIKLIKKLAPIVNGAHCLQVNVVSLSKLLIIKTLDQMVVHQLYNLLCIQEPDSINVDQMLHVHIFCTGRVHLFLLLLLSLALPVILLLLIHEYVQPDADIVSEDLVGFLSLTWSFVPGFKHFL